MADGDLRDQIVRLEADIEQLAERLDRCRKAMLLSKVAIGAGGICILAYFLGISFDPTIVIGALAAIIGGIVILGSNSSTSKQTMAAMKDAEAQRAELIGMIDLRTVGTGAIEASRHQDAVQPQTTGLGATRSLPDILNRNRPEVPND